MTDLIRTQQLDIMLSLGSMCAIVAFFIVMTGMNTRKKKALFILETGAAILLISARITWIYNGQPGELARWMSRIFNFFDFLGIVIVLFAFNMYLKEMLAEENRELFEKIQEASENFEYDRILELLERSGI